jgi:hypothetical protein
MVEAQGLDDSRFAEAIRRFDAANAEDPNRESVDGHDEPKELLYARRMTAWMERFAPDASEALRLAARCQHIRRWTIPRASYPMDRRGYLRWRTDLKNFHAQIGAEILADVGYGDDTIKRVQTLLRKEGLRDDPEVQTLEDVICLAFLENYFADFAEEHDPAKIVDIVRKTWAKMSEHGHEVALTLPYSPAALALVQKALSEV